MVASQNPAIDLLAAQIVELEQKANAYRASVNILCEKDGLPPMFPDGGGNGGKGAPSVSQDHATQSVPMQIKPDTFYGRPQQTAVRELLSIRKTAGHGPAKPAEILEGLRAGGYQVEAKNDDIALVGLRAMLRKRSAVFHKLPNGAWGLREWYPNLKASAKEAPKGADGSAHEEAETEAEDDAADAAETSAA